MHYSGILLICGIAPPARSFFLAKNTQGAAEDEDVVKQVGNMMHAAMGEFNAKSYDEEVLGEVGSVMWEEDTENEDMVKQVGDSCIAVQYV